MKYTAEEIKILKDLEAVRERPAMYIGSTGPDGLHHLLWEIVDNSVDEAMAGFCTRIDVRILDDGSVEVEDNGRGIPVDIHPEAKIPAVEIVFTKLHAGGKFDKTVYKVSGGLHGVGASVVNALSEKLEVWVKRNGKTYYQRFERGKPKTPLIEKGQAEGTGTRVKFKPDPQIFEVIEFSLERILERMREISYIIPGLKIVVVDKRIKEGENRFTFHSDEGIQGLIKSLSQGKEFLFKSPVSISGEKENIKFYASFLYVDSSEEIMLSFVNTIKTPMGGTHETGFRSALTKSINQFAEKILKKKVDFDGNDIREGLIAAISVFVPDPQFEGQTKVKLGNQNVKNIVESLAYEELMKFFGGNPKVIDAIVKKAYETKLQREAEKRARDIVKKRVREGTVLPGKLADSQSDDPEECEIFVVEGESAGGSCKQARDRKFQAVLPLKGKILNVEKSSFLKMLNHEEIQALISALGCGIGKDIDLKNLRYGKIIITTDSDVDGSHIRTLLLTFFWRYMRPLIENGHIYIAQPPLFRVRIKDKDIYLKDDKELKSFILKRGLEKKGIKTEEKKLEKIEEIIKEKKLNIKEIEDLGRQGIQAQRFKGLGEMNPEQLWETTMNPKTRTLKLVTVKDAKEADEYFSILMGEKVDVRREFIQTHALEAKNLDI